MVFARRRSEYSGIHGSWMPSAKRSPFSKELAMPWFVSREPFHRSIWPPLARAADSPVRAQ